MSVDENGVDGANSRADEKNALPSIEMEAIESDEVDEVHGMRPACFNSTIQEILFVLTATMAIAMSSWLAGSIIVTSNFVGRALHMNQAGISWLAASSQLTSGALLLFFGRVADLFGRKSIFVGSLALFSIFCLAAGFSNDTVTVDVLNGIIGIFAAGSVPAAVGILSITYGKPSKRKNYAFACFSGGNPLGFVFGTICGGLATTLFGWRASFWLIAIIFFAFAVLGFFVIPPDTTDKRKFNLETVKHFDIVGTLLTIGGIGMFSAAISLGSNAAHGWKTAYVLALLIVGFVLMVAFVYWEKWCKDPIVPMSIWKDRDFTIGLVILMLGFGAFEAAVFFIALFFQRIWHMSALMVAVHVLPMAVSGILTNIFAGLALHRVSNKLLMYIGTVAYTIATLLLALNKTSSSYWAFCFPALCIIVLGADLEFNVVNMYVISSMPSSQQSVAGSIFQTVTRLCMTLGLGISTAVFDSVQSKPTLAKYWDPAAQPYSAVFWFAFACSALSLLLVPFLRIGTQGGQEKSRDTPVDKEESPPASPAETDKDDEK